MLLVKAHPRWRRASALLVLAGWIQSAELAADETAATDSSLSPRDAMIRSALLPGWGQYSNGRPVKAALFGASTGVFVRAAWKKVGDLSDASDRIRLTRRELELAIVADRSDVTSLQQTLLSLEEHHQDEAARRNTYFLRLFALMTFAALDAYIDAHLFDFGETPTQFEMLPNADGLYGRVSWKLD